MTTEVPTDAATPGERVLTEEDLMKELVVGIDGSAHSRQALRWAAGIGARYYTAIGPVRFDVAVPLNKRSDDASWQVYISIGQSF